MIILEQCFPTFLRHGLFWVNTNLRGLEIGYDYVKNTNLVLAYFVCRLPSQICFLGLHFQCHAHLLAELSKQR